MGRRWTWGLIIGGLLLFFGCADGDEGTTPEFDGDECPGGRVYSVSVTRGESPPGSGPELPDTGEEAIERTMGYAGIDDELSDVVVALARGATVATEDGEVELLMGDGNLSALVVHEGDAIASIGIGQERGGYYVDSFSYCETDLGTATTVLGG